MDGNARLRYANSFLADLRIDSSDVSKVLARQQMQQKLYWRRNRIELAMPPTHDIFVQHMNDQWQYGFDRAREALARPAGEHPTVRRATRFSRRLREA